MKMGCYDWARARAERDGVTPAEAMQALAERNGYKWRLMELEVGLTYQALMQMAKRHGYKKPRSWDVARQKKQDAGVCHA
jgi:hypothetical protein